MATMSDGTGGGADGADDLERGLDCAKVTAVADAAGELCAAMTVVEQMSADARVDQLRDEFVSLVTESLKGPLTAILGFTQLLRRPELGEDPRRRARIADALVSVSDRGPGIPASELPHVFERFYRGAGAVGQGAGMGLYLARTIADAHGGALTAESRAGHGSVFTLRLPLGERAWF